MKFNLLRDSQLGLTIAGMIQSDIDDYNNLEQN